jgi:hypothetical protein
MSAVSVGKKRAAPTRDVLTKKQKSIDDLDWIAQGEVDTSQNAEIMSIMRELVSNPGKIGRVKVACFGAGDDFISASERKKLFFHNTYIYLTKVPKEWLREVLFPLLSPALTAKVAVSIRKVDKESDYKILFMALGSHGQQKLMSHHKETFKTLALERHLAMNKLLLSLKWSSDFAIDWNLSGIYILSPEMPSDCETAKEHSFTHIVCRALAGDTEAKVLLQSISSPSFPKSLFRAMLVQTLMFDVLV